MRLIYGRYLFSEDIRKVFGKLWHISMHNVIHLLLYCILQVLHTISTVTQKVIFLDNMDGAGCHANMLKIKS